MRRDCVLLKKLKLKQCDLFSMKEKILLNVVTGQKYNK